MKWAITIQRRIRLALALSLLMLCLVVLSLIESYNLKRSSESFNSIFQDRLIPAVDLYSISDKLNRDQDKLAEYFHTNQISNNEMAQYLDKSNAELGNLLEKYERTYLVKDESNYLISLKKKINASLSNRLELLKFAKTNKALAREKYFEHLREDNPPIRNDLGKLVKIQTEVGKNLLSEYRKSQANSVFVTNTQMFIAIVLGLLIMILVITDKHVLLRQENYKMN